MTLPAASLCATCAHVRVTRGRLEQVYLLCRNDDVPEKYPPQPVSSCSGYAPAEARRP